MSTRKRDSEKASAETREWLDGLLPQKPKSKRRIEGSMTDLIRQAIIEHDNLLRIAQATGLDRASLRRFRDGETSLRLDCADKLASYFDIKSTREQ